MAVLNNSFAFIPHFQHGDPWHNSNDMWVKGFAYLPDNTLLKNESLAAYLKDIPSRESIPKWLARLNGRFCATGNLAFGGFAAVDRIRSLPLFYQDNPEKPLEVSDSPWQLSQASSNINPKTRLFFDSAGFLPGDLTLIEKVKQVEAGTYLLRVGNQTRSEKYFSFATRQIIEIPFRRAARQLSEALESSMERMFKLSQNKKVVVPLTGGYDSRFILLWLARQGAKNLSAYTAGREEYAEFKPAKQVATRLNVSWKPIVYTHKLVKQLAHEKSLNHYIKYASLACSMPFFQDYPALKTLNLTNNAVIVGGHSGDFIAGSHLWPLQHCMPSGIMARYHMPKVFPLFRGNRESRKQLIDYLKMRYKELTDCIDFTKPESIDFDERQAKFIVNSCRTYDYFTSSALLPLFDNELIDFFKTLSFKYRFKKKLYNYVLEEYYFKPNNLLFKSELQPDGLQIIRSFTKQTLQAFLGTAIKQVNQPDDFLYREMAGELYHHFGLEEKAANYTANKVMTQWFLDYYKNEQKNPAL